MYSRSLIPLLLLIGQLLHLIQRKLFTQNVRIQGPKTGRTIVTESRDVALAVDILVASRALELVCLRRVSRTRIKSSNKVAHKIIQTGSSGAVGISIFLLTSIRPLDPLFLAYRMIVPLPSKKRNLSQVYTVKFLKL